MLTLIVGHSQLLSHLSAKRYFYALAQVDMSSTSRVPFVHQEPKTQHTLSVYFCGQEDCGPNHSFGPAMRPHYLLHVIFHGKGIYQCSGHTYHLKAGDAFLIRPMDSIYYRADTSDPWSYAWAGFDGSACKEILKQTVFSDTPIFTPETPARQNSLLTHMQSLLDTFSENNGTTLPPQETSS